MTKNKNKAKVENQLNNKSKDKFKDESKIGLQGKPKGQLKDQTKGQVRAKLKEYDAIKQQLEELQAARKIDQTRYTELEKAHDDLAVQNQAYHNKIDELKIENSNLAKKQAMLEGEIEDYRELIADDKSKIADLKSKGTNSMWLILMEALVIIVLVVILDLHY